MTRQKHTKVSTTAFTLELTADTFIFSLTIREKRTEENMKKMSHLTYQVLVSIYSSLLGLHFRTLVRCQRRSVFDRSSEGNEVAQTFDGCVGGKGGVWAGLGVRVDHRQSITARWSHITQQKIYHVCRSKWYTVVPRLSRGFHRTGDATRRRLIDNGLQSLSQSGHNTQKKNMQNCAKKKREIAKGESRYSKGPVCLTGNYFFHSSDKNIRKSV